MIAQTRPDIANVTEQTVLALKDLESRIGILKGDLAALCQGLGHPEAARIAAAPANYPAYGALGYGSSPNFFPTPTAPYGSGANYSPSPSTPFGPAYGVPWSGAWSSPSNPVASQGWSSPTPWGTVANPWTSGPGAIPTAGIHAPTGLVSGPNPYAQAWIGANGATPFGLPIGSFANTVGTPFGSPFGAPFGASFGAPYATATPTPTQNPFAAVPAGYR